MNLYNIRVKNFDQMNSNYSQFIVIGNSINDMLENLYNEITDGKLIPYYLRSSNFEITCLGEFTPDKTIKMDRVLCARYENWRE